MNENGAPGCGKERLATGTARAGEVAKPAAARSAFRRYGPLAVVAAAMALVFAMGWHHRLTLENIVIPRDRFHHVLAEHAVLSVLAYVIAYILMVALSLPGGLVLTVTGGLLFGALVGGLAAVAGATIGSTLVFLIARSALGEALSQRAGPWLAKLREGFKE